MGNLLDHPTDGEFQQLFDSWDVTIEKKKHKWDFTHESYEHVPCHIKNIYIYHPNS